MATTTTTAYTLTSQASQSVPRELDNSANNPVPVWEPGLFARPNISPAGQEIPDDEAWADLAAAARAQWAEENPY